MAKSHEQTVIEEATGLPESACSCNRCQGACHIIPCIGTPQDILNLVNNGHTDKLIRTTWLAGVRVGMPPVEMIQIRYDHQRRRCPMLTDQGLCSLHQDGLKPLEGKLSSCYRPPGFDKSRPEPGQIIAAMWAEPYFQPTVRLIERALSLQPRD
jgi:hypothetical protein